MQHLGVDEVRCVQRALASDLRRDPAGRLASE